MIVVVDIKISNLGSVSRALEHLKQEHIISSDLDEIQKASKLIFPGVGSFYEAMRLMKESGLDDVLRKKVLEDKTPIFGICLGMQLFASFGEEGGGSEGLGFVEGSVVSMRSEGCSLRLPHIGWNDVIFNGVNIAEDVDEKSCFYFIHSYILKPEEDVKVFTSQYELDFVAGFQKDHILGMQFHPEKSQKVGLKLLKNFCEGKF